MSPKKAGPILESAATLPEELALISAIVADLTDDTPKLIYSDWLDDRRDPRAEFVRDFVAATRSLKTTTKLPDSSAFPRAWTNMLGVSLIQGIITENLTKVKESVLRVARPIVAIKTEPVEESLLAVGGSKFGGHPDLPSGVDWPRCKEGPLGFLGQIAVADLRNFQVAQSLPQDGLLSFFAYQSFETGYQPGVGELEGNTQILYSSASEKLKPHKPPEDVDAEANGILAACRLTLCETWDLPLSEDQVPAKEARALRRIMRDGGFNMLVYTCLRPDSFGHHLLGYSRHGRRSDDPSPGPDWVHLMCLGSDDNLGWSWCDGQDLAVFVHEDDLRNTTFKRIFAYAS